MEREVALGWTVVLVPAPLIVVAAFGSYSGNLLPWFQAHVSLGWAGVAAIAITAFAAAYAATEAAPPSVLRDGKVPPLLRRLGGARVLALSLACLAVSLLKPLGAFLPDAESSQRAATATWWGIPAGLCLWALAAVTIARETEEAGTGTPADDRQWRWFVALRASRRGRWLAYAFLFGGTLAFMLLGSVPGVIWRTSDELPAWTGHIEEPVTVPYVVFFLWSGILAGAGWVYLAHAFYARPSGLPTAEIRRAWYSVWAAGALVVVMTLFIPAGQGWLAQPLLDVVLALYALVFVLMIVDASAAGRHRRVKSSFRRRTVGSVGVIGFALALPVIVGLTPFRAGLAAAILAAAIPLAPVALRALFGIERLPPRRLAGAGEVDSDHVVEPLLADPVQQGALLELLSNGRAK